YGYLPQLQSAHNGGHASWYWLTGHYVDPAKYPWIHLYQCQGSQPPGIPTTVKLAGVTLDIDIPFRADWGQHDYEEYTLTPNDMWMAPCRAVWPAGSHEAERAAAQGAKVLDDGSVEEIHPAVDWLTALCGRVATLEEQVPEILSRPTVDPAAVAHELA